MGKLPEEQKGKRMNWVAPIKDEKMLKRFTDELRKMDDKYFIMFEIGVGTGLQLQEILKLKNRDVRGKNQISVSIGTKNIRRTFRIPKDVKQVIMDYTEGKDPDAYLILGHPSSSSPLSREQAYRAFKVAGKNIGLPSIGAQTMRKTFAWRYYHSTGDIYYIQNLLNHASPSITYRYIGERPNTEAILQKLTPEENERSRFVLSFEGNGKRRMQEIRDVMDELESELDNPYHNSAFYGRVDCLLTEMENLVKTFRVAN